MGKIKTTKYAFPILTIGPAYKATETEGNDEKRQVVSQGLNAI